MKIINGDIFEVAKNKGIIMHQVNCCSVMSSGIALAFKNNYPQIYKVYERNCVEKGPEGVFGEFELVQLKDKLFGVNSYSQLEFGTHKKQTDEHVLVENIYKLDELSKILEIPAYVPYLIGCALGGGDWNIIEEALKETSIIVVKFDK